MRLAILLAALGIVGLAGYFIFSRGREIDGPQARTLVTAGAKLLDVRSPDEYARGHLPEAINIPVQEIDRRLSEVGSKQGEVVVYCRSGNRSLLATQILRKNGFSKVHNLGPMSAW